MTDPTQPSDTRTELGEFLRTRRARLTPADVGLPIYAGGRRVPGLRREEVALLAGMSVEYYTRIERGSFSGVSDSVLQGIAHALHLDEAEQSHLHDLAGAPIRRSPQHRQPSQHRVRPALQQVLDAMPNTPAFVHNGRLDVLATNALGRALNQPLYDTLGTHINHARFLFLERASGDFWRDWDKVADQTVATLRTEAGRDPYDRDLSDLVGELATRSDQFRTRWATHNVRLHTNGAKRIHHPLVGDLDLHFESIPLPGDTGQTMLLYTAQPESRTHEALNLLASWNAAAPAHATKNPARTQVGIPAEDPNEAP
ncbi:MAG TPA: helix-turn-helix transcriptional regulator [Propionicimonas sp.]